MSVATPVVNAVALPPDCGTPVEGSATITADGGTFAGTPATPAFSITLAAAATPTNQDGEFAVSTPLWRVFRIAVEYIYDSGEGSETGTFYIESFTDGVASSSFNPDDLSFLRWGEMVQYTAALCGAAATTTAVPTTAAPTTAAPTTAAPTTAAPTTAAPTTVGAAPAAPTTAAPTTVAPALPATGSDTTTSWVALAALLAGTSLVLLARRNQPT